MYQMDNSISLVVKMDVNENMFLNYLVGMLVFDKKFLSRIPLK